MCPAGRASNAGTATAGVDEQVEALHELAHVRAERAAAQVQPLHVERAVAARRARPRRGSPDR